MKGSVRTLVAAAMVLTISSCASPARETPQLDSGSTKGAAVASLAEAHHQRADISLKRGDRKGAKAELERLIVTANENRQQSAESHDIIFDAAARLARLHIEDKEIEKAINVARAGLEHEEASPPTLFRGYLHQVLAQGLEANQDLRGAVEEHGRAIEIFKAILNDEKAPTTKEEEK